MRQNLTVIFPVLNEEANLPQALNALGSDFARRVVVIDSGSTDRTCAIAREHGAEVIHFKWDGRFPKKRNWFLREHTPSTEWVLFLDADEWLTDAFKAEVCVALPDSPHAGYWLNYTIYFEGHPLKGGYPLKKLALFRVGTGEYERIDEDHWSALDMEIHEHPVLNGSTGVIRAKIDHRDLRGLDHWKRKHAEYAAWEARRYWAMQDNAAVQQSWSIRQKLKYRLMGSRWLAPIYFVGSLILLGGWKDGWRGVQWAWMKADYFNRVSRQILRARLVSRGPTGSEPRL